MAEDPARPDPLDQIRHALANPYGDDSDPGDIYEEHVYGDDLVDIPAPTHWPSVPAADAASEWEELRAWVEALRGRFAYLDHHVIPRCWWRHNGHVEALAALRDHERSSYSATAPATAPLDWLRALRDMAALLKAWTAESGCGSSHQDPPPPLGPPGRVEWDRHVQADLRCRREREIERAADSQG